MKVREVPKSFPVTLTHLCPFPGPRTLSFEERQLLCPWSPEEFPCTRLSQPACIHCFTFIESPGEKSYLWVLQPMVDSDVHISALSKESASPGDTELPTGVWSPSRPVCPSQDPCPLLPCCLRGARTMSRPESRGDYSQQSF